MKSVHAAPCQSKKHTCLDNRGQQVINKLCFINKVREEHVQIINTSGEHSAINGKRYIYTQQSHLIPLTVLQQRRPTGRAKPAGPKNRLPSHHRRLPAQDPDRFAHQDAATGLQQAWAAHQIPPWHSHLSMRPSPPPRLLLPQRRIQPGPAASPQPLSFILPLFITLFLFSGLQLLSQTLARGYHR